MTNEEILIQVSDILRAHNKVANGLSDEEAVAMIQDVFAHVEHDKEISRSEEVKNIEFRIGMDMHHIAYAVSDTALKRIEPYVKSIEKNVLRLVAMIPTEANDD